MLAAQEFLFDLNPQLLFDAALLAIAVFFLYMLMSYLLFNPARKLLKDRQDHISSELDEASADKEKAAALKAEYEAKLKEIDKEAETILADARQKALKNQNRIVNEANETGNDHCGIPDGTESCGIFHYRRDSEHTCG